MDNDTDMGGRERRFPATRHSMVEAARSLDPEERRLAFDRVVQAYWKPVYVYLRLRWRAPAEDAKDLTQGFFARAFEKRFFDAYDPARARFRTFLRTCLDGYAANEQAAERRLKRGGGAAALSFDFATAERDLPPLSRAAGDDADAVFHREWVRAVCAEAVEDVRRRCRANGRELALAVFERCDLSDLADADRPSYAALAAEFGVPLTQVTNLLASARREFRAAMLETLRARTASDAEFADEVLRLLGRSAP
jgi:DNA-directed RNA polymerase specialized sigma24 family protein